MSLRVEDLTKLTFMQQGKVTLALLDKEDLRGLAHLMQSYPEVLKEKALHL